jgi:endoglucanase
MASEVNSSDTPSIELLQKMLAAPSPSGYEQPVQEIFRNAARDWSDEVHTDLLGNTYAILNSRGNPKVMLAGHCDEIGFLVTHIHKDGFLYFGPIGGHDANIAVGQRVLVHTAEHGTLPGVIGKKPVHLMEDDERGKKSVLHDLFVDIGVPSRAEAEKRVGIGDPITYAPGFEKLENGLAAAHAFDDKAGAFVVAETVRLLATEKRSELKAAVYGVSTVQEEVGLRGARTSAYFTGATVGVAIDVGHAADYPGVDKRRVGDVSLGKGPIITRGPNINPQVYKMLLETAHAENIPYQIEATGRGTGTDANAMQLNQAGMATGLLSVPLRYMHTPCEVISLQDAHNTARLLAAFIRRITPETDFTPSLANLRAPKVRPQPLAKSEENEEAS